MMLVTPFFPRLKNTGVNLSFGTPILVLFNTSVSMKHMDDGNHDEYQFYRVQVAFPGGSWLVCYPT